MAYNWGTGLGGAASGAASGAAIGAMFGGIGAPVGGVLGGAVGLLGGFTGEDETQQFNPYTQSYWDMASQNMANYQKQMGSALGQQEGMIGQAGQAYNQLQNFQATAQYDPSAAMRMTRAQLPQLQQMAQMSLGEGGMSQDATQQRMESAAQQTAAQFNRMGGLGSGSAQGAIGGAVAEVQGQADMQQQQLYQNAFLNQLGQAQQANLTGLGRQFQAESQADQLRFQGISGAAGGFAGLGQQYGQRASMFSNLAGQSQASMANMAGPEFTYKPAQPVFGGLLDGLNTAASVGMLGQEAGLWGRGSQAQAANFQGPQYGPRMSASPQQYASQNQDFTNPYDNPFMNEMTQYPGISPYQY